MVASDCFRQYQTPKFKTDICIQFVLGDLSIFMAATTKKKENGKC